jgi:hypothetical protein
MNTSNGFLTGTTKDLARQLGIGLLVLLIILLTIRSASALAITQISAPATIHEGETLHLTFTTDTPANDLILRNGAAVSTTNTYDTTLGYDDAGLYTYTFQAITANATATATRTVNVLDTPLTITLLQPAATDYAIATIPVNLATNIPADLCYVVALAGTNTLTQLNATTYNGTVTLADGIYELAIKCNRNGEVSQRNVTLRVDTTPPTVSIAPSGGVTDSPVLLTATTNEAASCKYDTLPNPYDQMAYTFPESASLTHTVSLSLAEGTYNYAVACRDVLGNTAQPSTTTFTVQYPPTAIVSVDESNPHKAGTYKVTLTVSTPLQAVPTLTLTYQGGSSSTLALTQLSPLEYEGYVIVPADAGQEVGSFQFKGVDTRGVEGSQITAGDLFIVDTVKPAKVTSFKAVNGSGSVNLTWYDTQPDVAYNIYRSTQPGVTYTDQLVTAPGFEYRDFDVKSAVTYYYRIAAVDAAGNVGDLSDEEYASAAAATYNEQGGGALLDPVLQVGLNTRLAQLESKLLDADQTIRDLQGETDPDRSKLITDLGLLDKAAAGRRILAAAKEKLTALRSLSLAADDFNMRVTAIQNDIDGALASMPTGVAVTNKAAYDVTPDAAHITAAVNQALLGRTITSTDRDSYEHQATDLQAAVKETTTVLQGNVTYMDGLVQPYTIIEKRLLAKEPQQNVIAIETIPKEVAQRAADISFLKTQPVVLVADPVVQYTYDTLADETVLYAMKGTIDPSKIRGTSIVLLPKLGALETTSATSTPTNGTSTSPPPTNAVTGNALVSLGSLASGQGLLILLGLIIIAALLVYYFKLQGEQEEPGTPSQIMLQPTLPGGPISTTTPIATILIERREEPLAGLLLKGHTLIDANKYLDALHFYREALNRFEEEPFPGPGIKEAVRQELALLHAKLSLFDTLSKAHEAAYAENHAALAEQMARMRGFAAQVGDGPTPLVEKAKLQYQYLYNRLNQLRIENGAVEQFL